jgi:hypothetical protein
MGTTTGRDNILECKSLVKIERTVRVCGRWADGTGWVVGLATVAGVVAVVAVEEEMVVMVVLVEGMRS